MDRSGSERCTALEPMKTKMSKKRREITAGTRALAHHAQDSFLGECERIERLRDAAAPLLFTHWLHGRGVRRYKTIWSLEGLRTTYAPFVFRSFTNR